MADRLEQVGVTEDGRPVLAGVFALYDTHGVPLDIIFQHVRQQGQIPSWLHFYCEARWAGWPHRRIVAALREAIGEVWGSDLARVVVERLTPWQRKHIARVA